MARAAKGSTATRPSCSPGTTRKAPLTRSQRTKFVRKYGASRSFHPRARRQRGMASSLPARCEARTIWTTHSRPQSTVRGRVP